MGIRGGFSRGSTLIYHSEMLRSRTHFPADAPVQAFSRWPELSDGLFAVLFPFIAILNSQVFYHRFPVLVKRFCLFFHLLPWNY